MPDNEQEVLVLTNEEGKVCRHCGQFLSIFHFYRKKSSPDGHQHWCMDCQRSYKKQRELFRAARRLRIADKSVKEILAQSETMTKGELSDVRIIFANALSIVEKLYNQ